jgi:glycosyltransferase involved in cell wall biosynthesis
MIGDRKVAVVLPAYNAEKTLRQTYDEIPHDIVDDIILTDDCSTDATVLVAMELGIHIVRHDKNRGYGGNQKSCYTAALARGADIVVMLHPDYQYSPRLVTAMAGMVASGHYDAVFASRILSRGALEGGMPRYKYVANRLLTALPEFGDAPEAVGISHRLPRLEPGGAGEAAAARLLRRFRVRQSDDRTGRLA